MTTLPKAYVATIYGIVARALDRGYMIKVHDEEDHVGGPHSDIKSVLDDMGHSEMNTLAIVEDETSKAIGTVLFIHVNEPEDNPADYSYTTSKEAEMRYIAEGYRRA